MSLLQSTESVYSQIEDKSVFYTNQTIKGIEDQLAVGSFALGSINRQIHYGFNTNVVLSVSSTSANDAEGAPQGAKSILVRGLFCDTADSNRYKVRQTTFPLLGAVAQTTPISGTNSFAVINSIEVITVGTSQTNQGVINVVANGTTDLYGCIQVGQTKSNVFSHAVGYNQSLLVKEIHISSMCHTACVLEIFEQNLNSGLKTLISKIHMNSISGHINQPLNHKVPTEGANVLYANLTNLEPILAGDTNHICCNITSLVA